MYRIDSFDTGSLPYIFYSLYCAKKVAEISNELKENLKNFVLKNIQEFKVKELGTISIFYHFIVDRYKEE